MRAWRVELCCLGLLVIVGAIAWGFILDLPLTSPDTWPIMVQGSRFLEAPGTVLGEKYLAGLWQGASFYRPVFTALTGMEWGLFGEHPLPWHLVRLLVLLACAWVAGDLAGKASPAPLASWLFAAFFVLLHPIQVETVPAVERMGDTLLSLATLGTLLLLLHARESRLGWRLYFGVGVALLAPGIKDSGLLVPLLAVLMLEPWRRKEPGAQRALRASLVLALGLAAHVALRLAVLGHMGHYDRVFRSRTPLEAFAELLRGLWVPQVAPWAGGLALIFLGMTLLLLPRLLREGRLELSPAFRRVLICSVAWAGISSVAMIQSPRFYARYAEGILPPVALVLALLFACCVSSARAARGSQRVRAACAATAVVLAACCVVLPGSPLVWSYPQWKEAGERADELIQLTRRLAAESLASQEPSSGHEEAYAIRVAARGPGRESVKVLVEPFPWLPAPAAGPGLVADVETAMVLMPYSLRAALLLDGWQEVQVAAGGHATPFRAKP